MPKRRRDSLQLLAIHIQFAQEPRGNFGRNMLPGRVVAVISGSSTSEEAAQWPTSALCWSTACQVPKQRSQVSRSKSEGSGLLRPGAAAVAASHQRIYTSIFRMCTYRHVKPAVNKKIRASFYNKKSTRLNSEETMLWADHRGYTSGRFYL